jgi:formylmethanofuran dehydrogenase subunit B
VGLNKINPKRQNTPASKTYKLEKILFETAIHDSPVTIRRIKRISSFIDSREEVTSHHLDLEVTGRLMEAIDSSRHAPLTHKAGDLPPTCQNP